mmetsp:Transcript_43291/g.85752  ORF Transcript_43291/g.85752 Transcript_43291/m.85752 type:complete len:713 (+) Transcript_43291:66-2204(+)
MLRGRASRLPLFLFFGVLFSVWLPPPQRPELWTTSRPWAFAIWAPGVQGRLLGSLATSPHCTACRAAGVGTQKKLKQGIASFYDGLTPLWLDVWGEHLHHGYYGPRPSGTEPAYNGSGGLEEHRAAQVAMIDEVLAWARSENEAQPRVILDVGCGVGGAARQLAASFPGACATGITLSPVQAKQAANLSLATQQQDSTTFEVQDALNMPEGWRERHDLVWSLESGEHMPNKTRFVSELARVVVPGGRIVVVTWCHRDLRSFENKLRFWESWLLQLISRCYYLPRWTSVAEYERLCRGMGLVDVRRDDWTKAIAPFWPAVIRSACRPRNFSRLIRTGIDGVRSAFAMVLMVLGYRVGLIKFGLITARKPAQTAGGASSVPLSSKSSAAAFVSQQADLEYGHAPNTSIGTSKHALIGGPLHRFSRPHTVRGTVIAAMAAVFRASLAATAGFSGQLSSLMLGSIGLVLALLCANTVCVGVNQIFDVDLDRVNKPYLPLASGEMQAAMAWCLVGGALVVGSALVAGLFSQLLFCIYVAGIAVGSLYSVPPFRLRRWPLAAACIIACVRGCMLNCWLYYAACELLFRPFAWDPAVIFLTRFMTVFAAMIAITKDLADVEGDKRGQVKTFASTFGCGKVATTAAIVLAANYLTAMLEGCLKGPQVFHMVPMVVGHGAALGYLAWSRRRLAAGGDQEVDVFYRRIWHLFYFEYLIYVLI